MSAIPEIFQTMMIGPLSDGNANEKLVVLTTVIKLLGIKIDSKLGFKPYEEICKKGHRNANGFGRLQPSPGVLKSEVHFNTIVLSDFSYCLLIWLVCSKSANNGINRIDQAPSN